MSKTSEKRARRVEARRKQQPQASLLRNRSLLLYGGIALLLIVIIVVAINIFNNSQPVAAVSPTSSGTPSGTPGAVPTEVAVPNMGANHVQPGEPHAKYNSTPPTSGPHYPSPAPWGTDAPLPEETWLHNMEHGGIVFLYNCPQGCSDLVSKIDNYFKTGPRSKFNEVKMVASPYNKVPNKLTLVAWNFYLQLDDWNDTAILNFFKAHQDKGPEDIP
jgi:hypothetical protein